MDGGEQILQSGEARQHKHLYACGTQRAIVRAQHSGETGRMKEFPDCEPAQRQTSRISSQRAVSKSRAQDSRYLPKLPRSIQRAYT